MHGPALFLMSRIRIRRILLSSKSRNFRTLNSSKRIPKSIPSRIHLPLRLTITIIIFTIITFLGFRPPANDSGQELFSLANTETCKLHLCMSGAPKGDPSPNEVRAFALPFWHLHSLGLWMSHLSNQGTREDSTILGFAYHLSTTNLVGFYVWSLIIVTCILITVTQPHLNLQRSHNTDNHSPSSGGCKTKETISRNPCSGDWKLKLKVVQLCSNILKSVRIVYFLLDFLWTSFVRFLKQKRQSAQERTKI